MREKNWTPGPWEVHDRRKAALPNIRIHRFGQDVAQVSDVHMRDPLAGYKPSAHGATADAVDALGLANAHLIAAAPELYDALEHIVNELELYCDGSCEVGETGENCGPCRWCAMRYMAQTRLAQARGEA